MINRDELVRCECEGGWWIDEMMFLAHACVWHTCDASILFDAIKIQHLIPK